MKIKINFLFLCIAILSIDVAHAQLLNKLKSKANQEVNKLEKGATSSAPTQGTPPTKNKLSANVTRTVVVKLGVDEIFNYSENCIDLGASLDQVSFILTKQNGSSCSSYKNGARTPVACPTGDNSGCQTSLQCSYSALKELEMNSDEFKKYVSNETESHTIPQPTVTDEQLKAMAAYMTPAQMEEVKKGLAEAKKQTANQSYSTIKSSTITFNGKKYGPYKLVQKVFLTADGRNFYAVVGESKSVNSEQMRNKMITSASSKSLVLGDNDSPMSCLASPDNSEFGYVALGLSSSQKYVIAVSSGKTYEMPFNGGLNGVWFSATGNHVVSLSQNQLYLDGQVIKTFTNDEIPNACDLFVSSDGKGVTLIKNNTVSFSDGDYFEYPLKIAIVNVGGKPYYKWMVLENKEVVVYQKPY